LRCNSKSDYGGPRSPTLVGAISAAGGVNYSYVDINPVNDEDGGQPGGNIRVAYLYNSEVLELANPNPGSPTDATEVVKGPALSFNPGRIEPNSTAWKDSRKPLAAHGGQYHILHRQCTLYELGDILIQSKPGIIE
jgi:predicted extracellular nuclease